jgi:hypothetical protein
LNQQDLRLSGKNLWTGSIRKYSLDASVTPKNIRESRTARPYG